MIIDQDRSTAPVPWTGDHPGWTQVTTSPAVSSSHTAAIRSMSPRSNAS